VSARTDTLAETEEVAEVTENGIEIVGPDATHEETTTIDHPEEIEICSTTAEVVQEAEEEEEDVATEEIAMADLEEDKDGQSERRAQVLHLRRRNPHQILPILYRSWSARDV
jgi:hypothetical protein